MFSRNKIYLLIFIGFLISLFISNYYVSKYDLYESSSDNFENHHMIKGDPKKYWDQANELGKDINAGKNFFNTGQGYRFAYLPEKIIYTFSLLANLELSFSISPLTKLQITPLPFGLLNEGKV